MAASVQPELDERTLRAVTEYMSVIETARALFEVVGESGNTYTVDLAEPACTCADFTYREGVTECKHIRRVRLEVAQVDTTALRAVMESEARDIESRAEELIEDAHALSEKAQRMRRVIGRLEEVA